MRNRKVENGPPEIYSEMGDMCGKCVLKRINFPDQKFPMLIRCNQIAHENSAQQNYFVLCCVGCAALFGKPIPIQREF